MNIFSIRTLSKPQPRKAPAAVATVLAACLLLAACSPSLSVTVHSTTSVEMTLQAGFSPVLKDFLEQMGLYGEKQSLVSAKDIARNCAAQGLPLASFSQEGDFVTLTTEPFDPSGFPVPVTAPTKNSLSFEYSPATAKTIVSLLPPETVEYLDLLMAPVLTGEPMTEDEYIDLVAAVYGPSIADELAAARFEVEIKTPGEPQSYSIPLTQILAQTTAKQITISW